MHIILIKKRILPLALLWMSHHSPPTIREWFTEVYNSLPRGWPYTWCIFNARYAAVASPCFPTGRKSGGTFYLRTVIRSRETFDILWWILKQIPFTARILSRDPSKGLRPVYQSWSTKHKSVSLLADAFLSYPCHIKVHVFFVSFTYISYCIGNTS